MSSCNFSIPFTGQAEDILRKADSAIKAQGGSFAANSSGGNFNVSVLGNSIRGSFTVTGNLLNVVIDAKPFLVPCSTIESFLKSRLV
ncbi:hypothetical protein EXU57_06090 [Segetibacter sp. 3557_3]|uniref:hypothetical protein n=1 Tax=Segetibacter sp. 3557_3 TaxID=2547429 RepID=UPI00105873D4|nr:hypothetical protein [Segetibacter sp. 3557_3]TDH28031.1 hypothetical protein EXU57_06090 [Segetibacter sp. 3557_3]